MAADTSSIATWLAQPNIILMCVCVYHFNSKKHSRQMDRQTKANYIYKLQANQKTHKTYKN